MGEVSRKTEVTTSGISLTTVLFLIFLVLKLTGYITWSWWWVTAPIWGPFALVAAIAIMILVLFSVVLLCSAIVKGIIYLLRK